MNFFLVKVKKFQTFFKKIRFLWSRYGAGTGTGTVTFSKFRTGTGTVINSYGSTTLLPTLICFTVILDGLYTVLNQSVSVLARTRIRPPRRLLACTSLAARRMFKILWSIFRVICLMSLLVTLTLRVWLAMTIFLVKLVI